MIQLFDVQEISNDILLVAKLYIIRSYDYDVFLRYSVRVLGCRYENDVYQC